MKYKFFYLGLVLVFAIYFTSAKKWNGYAYPDKNNLSNVIALGAFDAEEECIAIAINTLRKVSSIGEGDYECHKD